MNLASKPTRSGSVASVARASESDAPKSEFGQPLGNAAEQQQVVADYAEFGDKDAAGRGEIWPALIEKAYAILAQRTGKPGYEEIEGGLPGNAVEAITGNAPTDYDPRSMTGKAILTTIQKALDNDTPVTCATLADSDVGASLKKDFDKYGFYANHCYTFYSVDVAGQTLLLRNPWGSSHPTAMPVSVFKKCFDTLSVNKA